MKKIIIVTIELLFMLGLFIPTSNSQAAGVTFYVDNTNPACSDSGAGTVPYLPFCTISKGATVAAPSATVRVLAGTYHEKVKPITNGTPGNPITFSAAPGVTVTGDGTTSGSAFRLFGFSYITVDGFNVTGTSEHGIYVADSNNITISNNHVSYSGVVSPGGLRCGIYLSGTTYSTITGNITDHNSLDGIRLVNASTNNLVSNNVSFANAAVNSRTAVGINVITNSTSNTIVHNIAYANEDSGLNFYGGSGSSLVIGNVSYGNGDHGIDSNTSANNIIVGNTLQGNVTSGINMESSEGSTVINNIVSDNGLRQYVGGGTVSDGKPGNINVDALSTNGTTLNYNLYHLTSGGTQIAWASTEYQAVATFNAYFPTQETNYILDNPRFIAPAPIAMRPISAPYNMPVSVGNYYLQSTSPAIDSANGDAPSEALHDILGRPRVDDPSVTNSGYGVRTFDDRGAYEFFTGYMVMLPLIIR